MRTSNPVFNSPAYQHAPAINPIAVSEERTTMSVQGTAFKTALLVGITISSAAVSWNYFQSNPSAILMATIIAVVGGLIGGFVMCKNPKLGPLLAPAFAVSEGAFVAAISVAVVSYSSLSKHVGGEAAGLAIVGQAAGLTMAIALTMLVGYASGLIRLRGVAAKVVGVMTVGVMAYYLGAWLLNMLLGPVVPRLGWDASPIGIGFSVFVVVLASLNLVLDFQFVEDGVEKGLPRHYEWLAAFGILTTLVWLYIELLRLLTKLRSE